MIIIDRKWFSLSEGVGPILPTIGWVARAKFSGPMVGVTTAIAETVPISDLMAIASPPVTPVASSVGGLIHTGLLGLNIV